MDDKQKLAKLASAWRASRSIQTAVTKSVDEAYVMGARAGMRVAGEMLNASSGEILLMAGELTAGELRAVKAVLNGMRSAILAEADKS